MFLMSHTLYVYTMYYNYILILQDDGSEQYAMLLKSVSRRWFEELQKEQEEAANLPPSEVNPFSLPSSSSSSSSAHSSNEGAEATPTTGAVGGRGGGGGGGGGVGEGMSVSEKKHLVALYGCDTEEDYEMDDQELEAAGSTCDVHVHLILYNHV